MRKTLSILVCFVLLLCYVPSCAEKQHIYDNADLLTAEEEQLLSAFIREYCLKTHTDFVILTYDDYFGDEAGYDIANMFYVYNGFGFDCDKRGVVFFVDMTDRFAGTREYGIMTTIITDDAFSAIQEQYTPLLSKGEYYNAFLVIIEGFEDLVNQYWDNELE